MKHLLTCDCGKQHGVSPAQAGQQIACECGQSLRAPALRELRTLPPFQSQDSARPPKAKWSSQKGWLFVVGLLLLVGGGVGTAYYGYHFHQGSQHTEKMVFQTSNYDAIDLEEPEVTLDVWNHIRQEGLVRSGPPMHVFYQQVVAIIQNHLIVSLVALALGAGMMVASFVLKAPKKPPKPRRRR